jgi:hypothetical protein
MFEKEHPEFAAGFPVMAGAWSIWQTGAKVLRAGHPYG